MKVSGIEPKAIQPDQTHVSKPKDEAKPWVRNAAPADGGKLGGNVGAKLQVFVASVANVAARNAHIAINAMHNVVDPARMQNRPRVPVPGALGAHRHVVSPNSPGPAARQEANLRAAFRNAASSLYHGHRFTSAVFTAPDAQKSKCIVMGVHDPVNGEVRIIRNIGGSHAFSMMKIYKDSVGEIHVRWKNPKTGEMISSTHLRGKELEQANALAIAALKAPPAI